ncbi:Fatty acid desaturase [Abortiporus biennis]
MSLKSPVNLWLTSSPEYHERLARSDFTPPAISIKDVHAAVPRRLFERNTWKGLLCFSRQLAMTAIFFLFATRIDNVVRSLGTRYALGAPVRDLVSWALWIVYWFWQSVSFTGLWTFGHECGHDSLSPHGWINSMMGITVHTFVLTPYYAWRITHRKHHKGTNHLDRDETYHPFTRTDLKLPPEGVATRMDYKEIIEETPAFTIFKLVIRQFLGFQLYLLHNRKGNPKYPKWTSHYRPSSKLFKPEERNAIIISDVCMLSMLAILTVWANISGFRTVWNMYWLPWLWAHNWIVMFTYLQHSDPTIPYYRKDQWTFTRGALATVDRPVFGWIGEFFWHGINHHHVAHHFFVSIPFYNLAEATEAIKPVLGEHYCYDSTPTIYALWRSFTQCTFIESEGGVVFFKNQRGEAVRRYTTNSSKDGLRSSSQLEQLKAEKGIGSEMESDEIELDH